MNLMVIGLGKLGLPLAALLAEAGHKVTGYDSSFELIKKLQSGMNSFIEPELGEYLTKGKSNLVFTHSFKEVRGEIDIVFIIVPTPSLSTGHFSNENLILVLKDLGSSLSTFQKDGKIVIDIVSTVMPGTSVNELIPLIEKQTSMQIGDKIGFCYNPEFIALGSVIHDMQYPDMHLIGASSEWAGMKVLDVLSSIVKKEVPATQLSLTEAEIVKISVNNFVTMKISYANLLQQISDKIGGIDIDKVTSSIGLDSRIGTKYLKAAAPYGGPCFPRDTRAMSALFKDFNLENYLSVATEKANSSHLDFLLNKISSISPNGLIGVAGISYKRGTAVSEESPGLELALALSHQGRDVVTWDEFGSFDSRIRRVENISDFVNEVDFIIITRAIDAESRFFIASIMKPHLDLWRDRS